jgi:hypothetical protein
LPILSIKHLRPGRSPIASLGGSASRRQRPFFAVWKWVEQRRKNGDLLQFNGHGNDGETLEWIIYYYLEVIFQSQCFFPVMKHRNALQKDF